MAFQNIFDIDSSGNITGKDGSGTLVPFTKNGKNYISATVRIAVVADYTTAGENVIGVTNTAAPRTITLSTTDTAIAGKVIEIIDESQAAGTNNISVVIQGGGTFVGGGTTKTIDSNGGSKRFISNGTTWIEIQSAAGSAEPNFYTILFPNASATINVTNINNAISAAHTAGGGAIVLMPGNWPINGSVRLDFKNNITIFGIYGATKILPQSGGTWENNGIIFLESVVSLVDNVNNTTKGSTSITMTTAAVAATYLAGDTVLIVGEDIHGNTDAEWHYVATNGNGGTGVVDLVDKLSFSLTSVTVSDHSRGAQNCKISDLVIDGTALTDTVGLTAVKSSNSNTNIFENLIVKNMAFTDQKAFACNAAINNVYRNIYVTNINSHGFQVSIGVGNFYDNVELRKIGVDGSSAAFSFTWASNDNDFYDIRAYDIPNHAIVMDSVTSVQRRNNFDGLDIKKCGGAGVRINGGFETEVKGTFTECAEGAVVLVGGKRNTCDIISVRNQRAVNLVNDSTHNKFNVTSYFDSEECFNIDGSSYNYISGVSDGSNRGGTLTNTSDFNIISLNIKDPAINQSGIVFDDADDNDASQCIITGLSGTGVDYKYTGTSSRNKINRLSGIEFVKTSAYTSRGEDVIPVDPTSGPVTITISAGDIAKKGKVISVKNVSASSNTITITPASGTIDGEGSVTITIGRGVWTGYFDGTNGFSL